MRSQWRERKRPLCLEQRYEFGSYAELRDFLDHAAELSERESFYPDMGFGRDYVNVTIHADEGNEALTDKQREFAGMLELVASQEAAVCADAALVRRVVDNLLTNAVAHSPVRETVTVRVLVRAEGVEIAIEDCGPGIPEEFREEVFDKYAQADAREYGISAHPTHEAST